MVMDIPKILDILIPYLQESVSTTAEFDNYSEVLKDIVLHCRPDMSHFCSK